MGNVTYDRLRMENAELRKQVESLKNQNSNVGDKKIFFKPKITDQELYDYVSKHPEHSEWIVKRYPDNRQFLTELADKSNPLYIPGVAEALAGVIEVENTTVDIEDLRQTVAKLRNDKAQLSREFMDFEGRIETMRSEIGDLMAEKEVLKAEMKNLHGEGTKQVVDFLSKLKDWYDSVRKNPDNWSFEIGANLLSLYGSDVEGLKEIMSVLPKVIDYLRATKQPEPKQLPAGDNANGIKQNQKPIPISDPNPEGSPKLPNGNSLSEAEKSIDKFALLKQMNDQVEQEKKRGWFK